jgi:hypothetical protein
MKNLICLLGLACLLFYSCEDLFEPEDEELTDVVEEVETNVTIQQYFYTSGNLGNIEYTPKTITWDANGIVLTDIEPDNFVQTIRLKNFNPNGTTYIEFDENSSIIGEFVTTENGSNRLYTTNIEVTFWDNYEQGGYINITDYNSALQTISGELQFTAWRWDNQLNREVSFGFYIQFADLQRS